MPPSEGKGPDDLATLVLLHMRQELYRSNLAPWFPVREEVLSLILSLGTRPHLRGEGEGGQGQGHAVEQSSVEIWMVDG